MSTQHTPGPWKVNDVFIENSPNRLVVSKAMWGGANIADCGLSTDDEGRANARLIASAPDLLAACKAADEYMTDRSETRCKWRQRDQDLFEHLRQAIARAEKEG